MKDVWSRAFAMAVAVSAILSGPGALAQPPSLTISADVKIDTTSPGPIIDRHIFGQFAEHLGRGVYEGVWVGEGSPIANEHGYRTDVLAALKALDIPVIRWPGGCFADQYHWRDGVGPRSERPVTVNHSWGGVEEPNSFGSMEFFGLIERLGADAYLSANVGSGSPEEMASWVEYLTAQGHSSLAQLRRKHGRDAPYRLAYLGVGNESWGCGGNMRAEAYADEYRRFAAFVPAPSPGEPRKVASGANADDYAWTETLMSRAAGQMDAISLHDYTIPSGDWSRKGAATGFDETAWAATLKGARRMDELIARHAAIMDLYDPKKRVALAVDEWGTWYDPEPGANPAFLYQQNSLRDALVAAVTLNIFQRHADRVRLAAIAQMVNVLQAMILTDGPRMLLTPTYDVFSMYRPFQDATALKVSLVTPDYAFGSVTMPAVDAVAAKGKDGLVHMALVNLDPHRAAKVSATFIGIHPRGAQGEILTAETMDAHNTFDHPGAVRRKPFALAWGPGEIEIDLPAKSLVVLALRP